MFKSILDRVKFFLSLKAVSIAIILVAISARIIQLVFFYNIRVDASYQVMATQHLLDGHGISLAYINPANLSEIIYKPLHNWPPGYSYLLVPFYLLFGKNYIAAGITLDIIMGITLILACRAILRRLGCSLAMQNICTVVNGFFIYYFYFIASSDAIGISFFCLLLLFTIKLLQNHGKDNKSLLWMVILSIIISFIKYLFIPVVFIIPLYFIIAGQLSKQSRLRTSGLIAFGILFIVNASFLLHQVRTSGSAAYISAPERGFFVKHLLDVYPFVPASFINIGTVSIAVGKEIVLGTFLYKAMQACNLALMIYITVYFFYWVTKKRVIQSLSVVQSFYVLAFNLSVAVFTILAILSTQVGKEEILPGQFWTYVEEPRYYGLITLLFQLGIFIFYRHSLAKVSKLVRLLFYAFGFLLLIETSRGMYLSFQRIKNIHREEYSWQYENRLQKAVGAVIDKVKISYPGTPVIITGPYYYYSHRVSLYSHVPILYEFKALTDYATPKSTIDILAVSLIDKKNIDALPSIKETIGDELGTFENYFIYARYIHAN